MSDPLEDLRGTFMMWRAFQFTSGLIFVITGGVTLKNAYDHIHHGIFGFNELFQYTNLMDLLNLWPILLASFLGFVIFRSLRESAEDKLAYAEAVARGEVHPR